jgi:hypothetical protein
VSCDRRRSRRIRLRHSSNRVQTMIKSLVFVVCALVLSTHAANKRLSVTLESSWHATTLAAEAS